MGRFVPARPFCNPWLPWPSLKRAFTLIELLIVIAVIAVLCSLLLPALSRSKARAYGIQCMNNERQLILAWQLYYDDYNDLLVYNLGGNVNVPGSMAPAGQPNWVNNFMDWTLSPDNTNTAFVATSLLGPYANLSFPIYHCPADKALSDVQRAAGWSARVRSVAMNAMVGNPGNLLNGGANVNNPLYRQFLKDQDIPQPSEIFVFLDEHPDSIDDGYFIDKPPTAANGGSGSYGYNPQPVDYEWIDLPGSYHNGEGSFSFADGHAELHQWLYDRTKAPPVAEGVNLPMWIPSSQTTDIYWVLQHMSIDSGN